MDDKSIDREDREDLIEGRNAVAEALRAGRPVIALESTIISHGMP